MRRLHSVDLIVPVKLIPDNSRVRKVTGTKEYVLRRDLKVHAPPDHFGKQGPISLKGNFLIADGSVSMVCEDHKLVWINQDVEVVDGWTNGDNSCG